MKQPKIKIFGNIHNVRVIEFGKSGEIEKIVYEVGEFENKIVFKSDVVMNKSLKSERKIQEPTQNPYFNYSHAPNLESLLISE